MKTSQGISTSTPPAFSARKARIATGNGSKRSRKGALRRKRRTETSK